MTLDQYIVSVGPKYVDRDLMVSERVYYPTGATTVSEPISEPIASNEPVTPKNTVKNKITTLSA